MERQHFIDQIKALSIFLIVFGHNDTTSLFNEYLTTFRLPLFFIISGYLSKDKYSVPFSDYLKKMTLRLLVPYFIISIFLLLFYLFIGRHFYLSERNYETGKLIIGVFYAQGGPEYMTWGIPMWYLPAVFCVSMIDFFVSKLQIKYRVVPALLLPAAGILIYKFLGWHLPWSLDIAMVAYLFYFFGAFIKRIDILKLIEGREVWIIIVFLIAHFIGATFNKPVSYYRAVWGFVPLLFLNGITSFMWIFTVFRLLPTYKAITWVGRNTLAILAFHYLSLTLIQGICFFVFGIRLEFTPFLSLLYSLVQILVLVPLILVLNKHLPFLVGFKAERVNAGKEKELIANGQ
jgi:acyltransferase